MVVMKELIETIAILLIHVKIVASVLIISVMLIQVIWKQVQTQMEME